MTQNEEPIPFDEEPPQTLDDLVVEIPSQLPDPYPDLIPSGFTPMEIINLQGRCYRNLASGRVPWWVITVSWLFQGFPAFFMLGLFLAEILSVLLHLLIAKLPVEAVLFINLIPDILLCILLLGILLRGTIAKLLRKR